MHLKRGSKSNLMNQYWGCIEFYAIKKKKEFYAIKKKKKNFMLSVHNETNLRMGGESGGKWIQVYVWLSPFDVHLK